MKILKRLLRVVSIPLLLVIIILFILSAVMSPIYWIVTGRWWDLVILVNSLYEKLEKFCFGENFSWLNSPM